VFKDAKTNEIAGQDTYDTVLYATGRQAHTHRLNLPAAGVVTRPSGKVESPDERTNVPHIYAVGDILHGRPELTPVAIKAGELLADRLFAGATKQMDYDKIPTTVFTPVEYGTCGLSEEDAIARFGEENIETYLFEFASLEAGAAHRQKHPNTRENEADVELSPPCLSKLVCLKSEGERLIGFHYVGPNAGEITQGFAVAVKVGAKKSDIDDVVGIHPTDAESFMAMEITRRSGESFVASGLCGGGKCG
jgi:pyruvate/2-oxoglutarate dehydrogenase complex dihydrolipoamide dehydrogenase (E3) component